MTEEDWAAFSVVDYADGASAVTAAATIGYKFYSFCLVLVLCPMFDWVWWKLTMTKVLSNDTSLIFAWEKFLVYGLIIK